MKQGITRFSSGQDDWIDIHKRKELDKRQVLIDAAKAGCIRAKATLQVAPHNISKLTLGGKEIF